MIDDESPAEERTPAHAGGSSEGAPGRPWTITGADELPIFGDWHAPTDLAAARGVVLLLHGFLGYKDYGMFPYLAKRFAQAGFIAHRFNFSHSGMTNDVERFERIDHFQRDTWNKQVFDVNAVLDAIRAERLPGAGVPYVLFGHSRGGVTAILTAGRRYMEDRKPLPSGVITASAPSETCRFQQGIQQQLLEQGYYDVKSNRTGQMLRVGRQWLVEQREDPEAHDVAAHVEALQCPLLVIHGSDDPTVQIKDAEELASFAARGSVTLSVIAGADHTFNTPNPMPLDSDPSPQLAKLVERSLHFLNRTFE